MLVFLTTKYSQRNNNNKILLPRQGLLGQANISFLVLDFLIAPQFLFCSAIDIFSHHKINQIFFHILNLIRGMDFIFPLLDLPVGMLTKNMIRYY